MKIDFRKLFMRYGIAVATVFLVVFTLGITMMTVSSIKTEFGMTGEESYGDREVPVMGTPETETENHTGTESKKDETTFLRPEGEEYILREYDGRIGIFRDSESEPVRVIQIYVMCLPEFDRQALRNGIRVIGDMELSQIIADFDG